MSLGELNVGFIAILHFPHPSTPKFKRISRIVIKPEWQGIGLGVRFMDAVADEWHRLGYRVSIATGLRGFIEGLQRSKTWTCNRHGRMGKNHGLSGFDATTSNNRLTATFIFDP